MSTRSVGRRKRARASKSEPPDPEQPFGFESDIDMHHRQPPNINIEALAEIAILPKIKDTFTFILALKNASSEDPVARMNDEALERLWNPPHVPLEINNLGIRHSISMYLALEHASQDAYNHICRSTMRNFAGAAAVADVQSFYNVEKLISTYTGVEPIEHDMCSESCIAFTGPYSTLDQCPMCGTSRWNQARLQASNGRTRVAAQKFVTIPLGPQLQAMYRHPDSARDMRYLHEQTQKILAQLRETQMIPVIDDIAMGQDYLGTVLDGHIKPNDVVLMVSLDGAQLYESKQSDCWVYIWIIINLSPDKHYHKIHNINSFLFVGMHHLAAIQNEGLTIWDASRDITFISNIHLLFTTTDGPGLVYWDGMVGHSGRNGCRMYCGVLGRRKTCSTQYYPVLLKPLDRCTHGSDHTSINVTQIPLENLCRLVAAPNQRQLDLKKTETGLTKPPLILGLSPSHYVMHLAGNISDLLLALWCGTLDCGVTDDLEMWDWAILQDDETWAAHGKAVEMAGPYLPGSFDCKPRNIMEKLNTSYKTWEFQLYTFGLAPALLYGTLPDKYWVNYCQLVHAFRLMCQHRITSEDLQMAHVVSCMINHIISETIQKGPPICYAQCPMERTIGNLGQELCQPSRPYANISREGVHWCKVNSLLSMIPELDEPPVGLPEGAIDLGEGFALLWKRDKKSQNAAGAHAHAITTFLGDCPLPHIKRWARLCLPNGQIARSAWRETLRPIEQTCMSRNVKLKLSGQIRFAEVFYFTRLAVEDEDQNDWHFIDVTVVQLYSPPDHALLKCSFQTVVSCMQLDEIAVVNVKSILSVIALVPHTPTLPDGTMEDRFFMLEKPGLDISKLMIPLEEEDDDLEVEADVE
ncbi:hypothetical protein DFH29DRAFT_990075 [Suillus ampliporus]|nr:hypothetical protein DFH29DRAFT_990075 [Suillus ampliporus]